ncbi:mitochondrial thiamine pyrophosphate carrier-like [Lineus longissimus]|uniref:mitochondrial thiamine pyrophosphate carrier-like n=1 Tax=Lineus longissimus TaxID=88925 RepID=UPI002B4D0798
MVGFDPSDAEPLTDYEYVTAGAVSGVMTRAVCQPLDVVKVRFQLQVEPIKKTSVSKYYSIRQAFMSIVHEERAQALWKGHIPAQALSVVFGFVQFGSFEVLTKKVWVHLPDQISLRYQPASHFICGGLSGCIASLASQPLDVLRTRLVAQGEPKVYTSLHNACLSMYNREGARSFFKGLTPTLFQVAPQTGLQFAFYAFFTKGWKVIFKHDDSKKKRIGGFQSLICGSVAGICSKAVVYPLDLTKKRLQVQGFEEARKQFGEVPIYRGLFNCLVMIVKDEGARGLYKGIWPSILKAALSVGITFYTYEQCCNILRNIRI